MGKRNVFKTRFFFLLLLVVCLAPPFEWEIYSCFKHA